MASGAITDDLTDSKILLDDRVRHLANLPGRYYLEKWRNADDRKVSSFACRIQRISPMMLSLQAPVGGELGDRVTAHFDEFGVLKGKIIRSLGFGFVASLKLSDRARARLAAKVMWFERRKNFEVAELRRHKRVVPTDPQSTLVLPDGNLLECFVINMSASGAAISADIFPHIGLPLALGTVVGRVVRHLEPGFAVEFIEGTDLEGIESRIIRKIDTFECC